ncbi:ankyrin repeat domain-containing protein [Streptomyces sp. NPDC126514]|uniref:ankyrin repeat domain-containing protein n=1 Tax=Streptomyces sp. NPDC126514 TaxID=3155210 RepID=UPI00331D96B2
MTGHGWDGMDYRDWKNHEEVRRRLDAGADPERFGVGRSRPLHRAALSGSPEVVAELARRVADVDALEEGVTALWEALVSRRTENARALIAAGADPYRVGHGGWTVARLSLAGPDPDLVPPEAGRPGLTDAERAVADEGRRLTAALGDCFDDGLGLACVAGIDAGEAVRRLSATPVDPEFTAELTEDALSAYDLDEDMRIVGVTTVPGGCVVTQPWGYAPQQPVVMRLLSEGTLAYGLYANPKSGNQGCVFRDGVAEGGDLHPGGGPDPEDGPREVLFSYVHASHAIAYCLAYGGLRPTDARSVLGPPDHWVRLPERDYWTQ